MDHPGAKDDTPANASVRFDAEHPPVYSAPTAIVTSPDFSPDGKLVLAVAGYSEVLLPESGRIGDRGTAGGPISAD
ncbi:MAG: hypothetical protein U0903_01420 [Planctomycetales bacterium]